MRRPATLSLKGFSKMRHKRRTLVRRLLRGGGRKLGTIIFAFSVPPGGLARGGGCHILSAGGRGRRVLGRHKVSCLLRYPFAGRIVYVRPRTFIT